MEGQWDRSPNLLLHSSWKFKAQRANYLQASYLEACFLFGILLSSQFEAPSPVTRPYEYEMFCGPQAPKNVLWTKDFGSLISKWTETPHFTLLLTKILRVDQKCARKRASFLPLGNRYMNFTFLPTPSP